MVKRGARRVSGETKRIRLVDEVNPIQESFEDVQRGLSTILKKPGFRDALESTLKSAVKNASTFLRPELYDGLNKEYNNKAWPESVEAWCGIYEHPIDNKYFKEDSNGIH